MSARRSSGRDGSNGWYGPSRYDRSRAESWRTSSPYEGGSTGSAGMTDRVQQMGSDMSERAQQMGADTQQQASELRDTATDQMYRVKGRFEQMLEDNPLALGAAALAAGALVGMVVPETRRENELMGEARQALGETVQERIQEVAQQAGQVMDRMQEESGDASQTGRPQPGTGSPTGMGPNTQPGMGGGAQGASGEPSVRGSVSSDSPMGGGAGGYSQTAGNPQGSQPRRPV